MAGLSIGIMALMGGAAYGATALANNERKKNAKAPQTQLIYPDQNRMPEWLKPQTKFGADQMEAMSRGESAPYLQDIGNLQRKSSMKALQDTFYGNQFQPGTLATQGAYDVKRGLGRGSSSSATMGAQLQNYTDRERQVDDAINQMVMKGSYDYSLGIPQMLNQTSAQAMGWGTPNIQQIPGYDGGTNNWDAVASGLGMAGAAVPYMSQAGMFNSAGNVGAGGSQPSASGFSFMNDINPNASMSPYNFSDTPYMGGNFTGSAPVQRFNPWAQSVANTMGSVSSGQYQPINYGANVGRDIGRSIIPWLSKQLYQ